MYDPDSSAVVALSELQQLEAERVARLEAEHAAEHEAQRQVQLAAERQAAEQARLAAEQEATRLATERAALEHAAREEQIRVQMADAHARAEHAARLQAEQMRIDAQIKLAERRSRPKWPFVVVPALVLGLGALGLFAADSQRQAERASDEAEAQRVAQQQASAEQADAMAAIAAKLDSLEAERSGLVGELAKLDSRHRDAQSDAEKAQLQLEKLALQEKLDANEAATKSTKPKSDRTRRTRRGKRPSAPRDRGTADKPTEAAPSGRAPIELGSGKGPLDGI